MKMRINVIMAVALGGTILISGACSTKRYVRDQVNLRANELTATMDAKDDKLEAGIQANASQVDELSGVARQHGQQIGTMEVGLKATDEKAAVAMNTGQRAQAAADQSIGQISALDQKFQSRNRLQTLEEISIPFAFGSARLEKEHDATLNQLAASLKSKPDAVLLMEGRTDATGDDGYNVQLGEKRVATVERFLVVGHGVPMHQIHKMSFGEDSPLADNKSKESRARNRAVVLRLMVPSPADTGAAATSISSITAGQR